jgi:hypothetical protein
MYSPSRLAREVKSITAREIFKRVPEVKKKLWGGEFWTKVCDKKHDPLELPKGVVHQKGIDGKCLADGVFIQRVKMSCHRPECPECWPDWRKRQVARVQKRFDQFEKGFNFWKKRDLKRCHGVLSVPKKLYCLSEKDMRRLAFEYLREIGVWGGSVVYHSKRSKHGVKYFSPHFHVYFHAILGLVDGEKVAKLYDHTRWVFRNFGERVLAKSISYQLSHAAVPPNHGHIVTWFGSMNYRKLPAEKYVGKRAKCPWGHSLDRYGMYVGNGHVDQPDTDGYSAYLPRDGWLILPKRKSGPPWESNF